MTGILSTSSLGFSNGSSLDCILANNNCEFLREAHATLPVVMGPNVSSNHNHDATIPAASKKKSCHSATHQISTTTHDSGHDSGIDHFLGCTNDLTVALPLGPRRLVLDFPGPPRGTLNIVATTTTTPTREPCAIPTNSHCSASGLPRPPEVGPCPWLSFVLATFSSVVILQELSCIIQAGESDTPLSSLVFPRFGHCLHSVSLTTNPHSLSCLDFCQGR